MNTLENKRVLVTGASRGIGKAIAIKLASLGADVAFSYANSPDKAAEVVRSIEEKGRKAIAIQADNAKPNAVIKMVHEAVKQLGGLDILINNAAITWHGAFEEMRQEEVDAVLDVNIRGAIVATQVAIPYMENGGRIIFMGSSLADRISTPGLTVYATTKAAQIGLTKGLARELGPKGITVNLVQPGATETDANPSEGDHADGLRALTPLGHYGEPNDIAETVAFLTSPEARQITGSTVTVDGGLNA